MFKIFKPTIIDILDITLVAILVYYFLKFLQGTRALKMVYALILLFIISYIAQILQLKAFGLIIDSLKAVWIILFVILFQPEIRNVLTRFGRYKLFSFLLKPEESKGIIEEITKALKDMKEKKWGALIVLEREIGLKEYIESGIPIGAKLSSSLLVSIFSPNSPLHDGACIISGDQIAAGGVALPLSDNKFSPFFGMRHRAGIGITEITDACAIILSETTGKISFAYKGNIKYDISLLELKHELSKILIKEEKK
ncbi:MAG: diadenylate cyclase CdaA [candidate division WOR-3 bacterium]|nr:diadenylate cyclase CdaA [candidate division WOR-3 bacterium]MCX7837475.1 diadenylate cyclase CdaA [candidate division WOR-3 bacterium]MDW8114222.1 diadenylate cyclase CdaA [candidate division WOR-3 bacterium]